MKFNFKKLLVLVIYMKFRKQVNVSNIIKQIISLLNIQTHEKIGCRKKVLLKNLMIWL